MAEVLALQASFLEDTNRSKKTGKGNGDGKLEGFSSAPQGEYNMEKSNEH